MDCVINFGANKFYFNKNKCKKLETESEHKRQGMLRFILSKMLRYKSN